MKKLTILLIALLHITIGWAQSKAYHAEEVTIKYTDSHKQEITLTGTLTIPSCAPKYASEITKKQGQVKYPAVLLISGSGQQNRDEELMGHKPFSVIAEYLARKGVAVLRVDDRGTGGSKGDYLKATTLDFAQDAEAEYKYLIKHKDIDPRRVGLIGHSEGGLIADIVASKNPMTAFVIRLAGSGYNGTEILAQQNQAIFSLMGYPDSIVDQRVKMMREAMRTSDSVFIAMGGAEADSATMLKAMNKEIARIIKPYRQNISEEYKSLFSSYIAFALAQQMRLPWFQAFLKIDPIDYLPKVHCPVLALNGNKDCQVLAKENLKRINQICTRAGVDITTMEIKGKNHLFQQCETGDVKEYESLGQAPDAEVLELMWNWMEQILD